MIRPRFSPFATTLLLAAALALPATPPAAAELVPHQAEYRITFGTAEQATPVGTARQKLSACNDLWKLERDVDISLALTQSLRFDIASVLRTRESQEGDKMSYRLQRAMNGERSQREGWVQMTRDGGRAILTAPEGKKSVELPAGTVLPVGLIPAAIERLKRGADSFSFETFDAEVISDNFLIKGVVLDPQELPPRFLAGVDPDSVGAKVWPLQLQFLRADRPADPPLFTARLRLHETGVVSRMILSYGWVNLAVDLTSFAGIDGDSC